MPNSDSHLDPETKQWLAIRRDAAKTIDPETALINFTWGPILDPYGVMNLPPEAMCIGRNYFARSPGSDIWVSFGDLSEATRENIQRQIRDGTARDVLELELSGWMEQRRTGI